MMTYPTVLCPTDFSEASRGALRYAAVIASHFGTRFVILAVEDPLLTEAIALDAGMEWDPEKTRRELATFVRRTLEGSSLSGLEMRHEVRVGTAANEILRVAGERACDLIVMSTHGITGARKLFFGATTERVLRETNIPVLATAASDAGPSDLAGLRRLVRRILIPVDLSTASLHQVQAARALSQALHVPLVLTHVIEPVYSPLAEKAHFPRIDLERRARAEDALGELLATVPRQLQPEALIAYGDIAEEISKIARDRQAGLIVIGLHGSPLLGPRMGSVTYRVLCMAQTAVLALPPIASCLSVRSSRTLVGHV
jgi:nucleotide-binding universal stress UspA family protein